MVHPSIVSPTFAGEPRLLPVADPTIATRFRPNDIVPNNMGFGPRGFAGVDGALTGFAIAMSLRSKLNRLREEMSVQSSGAAVETTLAGNEGSVSGAG
jgi:hypothetical protein